MPATSGPTMLKMLYVPRLLSLCALRNPVVEDRPNQHGKAILEQPASCAVFVRGPPSTLMQACGSVQHPKHTQSLHDPTQDRFIAQERTDKAQKRRPKNDASDRPHGRFNQLQRFNSVVVSNGPVFSCSGLAGFRTVITKSGIVKIILIRVQRSSILRTVMASA